MRRAIVFLINIYQKTISPDHGIMKYFIKSRCKFYPSCSEYAKQAFKKYNFIKAARRTLWRILRCNPLARGGAEDP